MLTLAITTHIKYLHIGSLKKRDLLLFFLLTNKEYRLCKNLDEYKIII